MRTGWIGVLVLASVLVGAAPLHAHDGHAHKIMGTVTARDDDRIGVRTPGGEVLSIALTPQTVVTRDKRPVAQSEVEVGRRVVVNIGNGADPLVAHEIRVGVTVLDARR